MKNSNSMFPEMEFQVGQEPAKNGRRKKKANTPARARRAGGFEPPNLGKATRLPVPDFGNPDRRPVCLGVDFPIAPVNALSNLEGNAGKPIYQMSKWWARRRSSVFRSLLIAAAVEAPDDPTKAAKLVWDYYYSNHQKAGHFKRLRVLDPFMGGGTTLVEGARLGFQMVGVDLNPVAWFVTRNELAASGPEQVRALFEHIEAEVKPLIQPFYTTTCPRGHKGRWYRKVGGQKAGGQDGWEKMPEGFDPLDVPPEERKNYRWEGPEVIYTFWAKHGPCQARGCGHRTPIFAREVVFELFQDLDKFNLGDYKRFDDEGRGMRRLVAFVQRAARLDGGEFRPRGKDVYELVLPAGASPHADRPGQDALLFTTDRDKALQQEDLNLLGLEHPVVKRWLDRYTSLSPEERALIGNIEGNGDETGLPVRDTQTGLITIWQVVVHGKGGQIQQRIVRLGISPTGERSPYLERLSKDLLNACPYKKGVSQDRETVSRLVNGTASELLHRELVYSGFLPEGASYSSKLLACLEVAP